ncbi:MAG: phosphate butyryltransferase [Candidatus Muiribacterium halophilum]|uniref:Phosphate butyryltransferase n=1 Tax=Muiribacterium halophilum TaxID=2053465 RepID=A0A2N5ZBY9_MUIH1|nr:MAG: phosphate butyryltransferase [Candidatus Muirbacterium halophilum]
MLKTMDDIMKKAQSVRKRKLSVAVAQDLEVLTAVDNAFKNNIIDPILVGDEEAIKKIAAENNIDISNWQIMDEKDDSKAALQAVKNVSSGNADMIMKGLVSTSVFLKAVLNREFGLRTGRLLSHVAVVENANYHKLLAVTDAAMNIAPDLSAKIDIVKNAAKVMTALGIERPKVAPVCAVETVNPAMEATLHAAAISKMSDRGQLKGCIVDGPLALDNAVSKKAAEHKGIVSEVAGDADIILLPDIEAGNVLYKALVFLADVKLAAIIVGAKAPVVLTSRADSDETKLRSIALAASCVLD